MWNSSYAKFFRFGSPCNFWIIHLQHPTQCHHKKKHPSYKIAPCDEHSTSSKNTNLIKTHFWRTQPPLMAPRLSSTRRAALLQGPSSCRIVSPHHPQQPGREDHLLRFPKEHYGAIPHHVKQLLREVLPIWQPMQLLDHPPTASNTVPPPKKNTHPTRLHHVTNIQLLSKIQIWINPILTYPTSLHGAKTFINASRSYATVSQLSGRVSTPPAAAHLWIVPTEHYGAIPHHVKQLLREVLPIWQPIQLPTGQQHATHRNHKTALIRQHWTM